MTSHHHATPSLFTARWVVRALSLAVAGLLVLSGQQVANGAEPDVPGPIEDYLVTFAAGTTQAEREGVLDAAGAVVQSSVPPLRMYAASLTDTAAQTMGESPLVTSIERDRVREVQLAPNDPAYADQWALDRIGWAAAYESVVPSGMATVAVLDTGVNATDDLAGRLVPGTSVLPDTGTDDPNGHGTAMASIVAAGVDNGTGIAGVAYHGVSVMPVKVLDADGLGQDSAIVEGVVYAADHGADVILMSFSNPGASSALQAAVDYAWSKGAVLVAATGNDGSTTASYPAGTARVVGVSATDQADTLWSGSNSGADTFLGAPGVDVASGFGPVTGTSASAAVVAGVAALVRANDPAAGPGVVVGRLARTADPAGSVSDTGNGRVNLARALTDSSSDPVVPQGVAGNGGPVVGPYVVANKNLTLTFAGSGGGRIAFSGLSPGGSVAVCTATCTRALDNNQLGTLTVTPNVGSVFSGWTGAFGSGGTTTCSGTTSPCTFSMSNDAQSLTVTFAANTAPTATVALSPPSPTTNQTVTATAIKADANGDPVTLTYVWKVNGTPVKTTSDSPSLTDTLNLSLPGNGNRGDVVRVEVTPNDGKVSGATVNASVTVANSSPVAVTDARSTNEDTALVVAGASLASTDTDADGDTLAVTAVGGATHGTVGLSAGSVTFNPAANYNGSASFTYTLSDGQGGTDTGTVNVTVNPVNDSPTADPKTVNVIRNSTANQVQLSGSDVETGAGALAFAIVDAPSHGTLSGTGAHRTYTPESGFVGDDTFTYTVTDTGDPADCSGAGCSPALTSTTATVTIHVTAAASTTTADPASATYGDGSVTLSATVTSAGAVNSGTVTFTLRRPDNSVVGSATTDASVVNGQVSVSYSLPAGTSAGSYTVRAEYAGVSLADSFDTDTVTIQRKALTITAEDRTKTYGQTVTFDGDEFTTDGLVNGDAVSSVTLTSAGAAGTATVVGSPYPIATSAALGTGLGNYQIDYLDGELEVTPKALTIIADDRTKSYGQTVTFDGDEFTTDGLVNGDAVSSVTLTSAGAAGTATVVGSPYPIVASAALGTGLGNYQIDYLDGELEVTAKALTITADDLTKTYGDEVTFTGTEFEASGLVDGDSVGSVTLTSAGAAETATVADSPYAIIASAAVGSGLANYDITYVDGQLTVEKKALTITADDQDKVYGEEFLFDGDEFSSSGLVNGDSVSSVTLTSAGAAETATVADSPYAIVASAAVGARLGNYTISYVDGRLTVLQRVLTITADDQSKTYGEELVFDGTEFSQVGLVNDDTVDSVTLTSAGAAATAGVGGSPYAIVPSNPAGAGLGNYDIGYVNGHLTIDAKALTITANDRSKIYGDELTLGSTAFTTGLGELVNGDTVASVILTSDGAAATANVADGPYAIVASDAVGSGLGNYDIDYVDGALTVNLRDLTVTADDRSKTYGNELTLGSTAFTTGLGELVNGDTVASATLTSDGAAATANVADGPYAIVASDAVGSGLGNYDIDYVDGALTVNLRDLTVTADDRTKTYGQTVTFAGNEFTTSGLVNSDSVTAVTLTSAGAAATATVAGSPYDIVASAATGTGLANYDIHYVKGNLTVNRALLMVTADNKSKLLNAANPALTGVVTGVKNGDPVVVTYSTTATQSSPVGGYTITPYVGGTAGAVLNNYDVQIVTGVLRVLFAWDGFLQPINDTAHQVGAFESKFKLGQTIPVKFDLKDANGVLVTQSVLPTFSRTEYLGVCDSTATPDTVPVVSPDGAPSYALNGGHYQYNWSTKSVPKAGEYRIFAHLADGTSQSVYICLTK